MGMATPSNAFCFSSYSSFSALGLASNQLMVSSMVASKCAFSSSGIFPATSSELMEDFNE
jgi:hypothetical protein